MDRAGDDGARCTVPKRSVPPAGADSPVRALRGVAPPIGVGVTEGTTRTIEVVVDDAVEGHRAGIDHAPAGVRLEHGCSLAGDVVQPDGGGDADDAA